MCLSLCIHIDIRRPLQSVERVRLHLLAYNIQSLSNSHPSKQEPEEAISPASPGGQAAEIEESYPPGTQAARIQDLGARMLESYHLIFFYRGSTRPQLVATGRPALWPRIQQISLNRCSRLHWSVKWLIWVPWLSQSSPHAPTSWQGPSQLTPQVIQGIQNATQIGAKSATRQHNDKHPSIQATMHGVLEVGGRGGSLSNIYRERDVWREKGRRHVWRERGREREIYISAGPSLEGATRLRRGSPVKQFSYLLQS